MRAEFGDNLYVCLDNVEGERVANLLYLHVVQVDVKVVTKPGSFLQPLRAPGS